MSATCVQADDSGRRGCPRGSKIVGWRGVGRFLSLPRGTRIAAVCMRVGEVGVGGRGRGLAQMQAWPLMQRALSGRWMSCDMCSDHDEQQCDMKGCAVWCP